jgi:hypothetical protein
VPSYDQHMTIDLPSWIECHYANERDEASALHRLIFKFEPESEPLRSDFREALMAVLIEPQNSSS